ncbi:hypothetical protein [Pseudoalteromonas tunicata]|uniref:hypothetical protein n=1 Tax=Pseudoalteromonas tunicata TaxID=314281 RepID=UPI00273EE841|nr:hypothetical protein [Pseudoalteromonas tunicata]MDP4985451.1 hypothetical protein [Pseudoalteromonas tunicata]MDP5213573.1 hypothetical protein [Pseudoalteromonas tunicata]
MKSDLLKYKHYLAVLLALAIANYLIEPLWNNLTELQQKLYLDEVKAAKIESLIMAKSDIEKQHGLLSIRTLKLQPYLFPASTESEFKLVAQAKVESILENEGCNVERIGWISRKEVDKSLIRWTLEARYRGNPKCALNVTRQLESQQPLVKIADYSYAGKEVSGNKNNYMVIALTLVMWQNAQEVTL